MRSSSEYNARINQAKTRVAKWSDTVRNNKGFRSKLLRGIDSIGAELPKRLHWFEVITVGLDGGGNLGLRIDTQTGRAFPRDRDMIEFCG